MPDTPLMLELQITQEYLGHSNHLVYLAPMSAGRRLGEPTLCGPASVFDAASMPPGSYTKQRTKSCPSEAGPLTVPANCRKFRILTR